MAAVGEAGDGVVGGASGGVDVAVLPRIGLGESEVARRLGALMGRDRNPLVGTTASHGVVSCRIRFEGDSSDAGSAIEATEQAVRAHCAALLSDVKQPGEIVIRAEIPKNDRGKVDRDALREDWARRAPG